MRIWTTQTVPFWDQLQEQGVVYCETAKSWGANDPDFKEAYDWMAAQMVRRIGPPPRPDIDYPIWGYQQVGNYKKEYHGSSSFGHGKDDEFILITANIPNDALLLSDVIMWHHVLNHCCIPRNRREMTDEEELIVKSWDLIFDLDTQHWSASQKRRNRWIQATFWELRREWVTETHRIKGYQKWIRQQEEKWGPMSI